MAFLDHIDAELDRPPDTAWIRRAFAFPLETHNSVFEIAIEGGPHSFGEWCARVWRLHRGRRWVELVSKKRESDRQRLVHQCTLDLGTVGTRRELLALLANLSRGRQ